MAREKTGLGKGLGALIPSEPKQQDRSYFTETTGYQEIPIGSISVNPYQPVSYTHLTLPTTPYV